MPRGSRDENESRLGYALTGAGGLAVGHDDLCPAVGTRSPQHSDWRTSSAYWRHQRGEHIDLPPVGECVGSSLGLSDISANKCAPQRRALNRIQSKIVSRFRSPPDPELAGEPKGSKRGAFRPAHRERQYTSHHAYLAKIFFSPALPGVSFSYGSLFSAVAGVPFTSWNSGLFSSR